MNPGGSGSNGAADFTALSAAASQPFFPDDVEVSCASLSGTLDVLPGSYTVVISGADASGGAYTSSPTPISVAGGVFHFAATFSNVFFWYAGSFSVVWK